MSPARHIALNAAFLDPGVSGGPESYMRGLVEGLVATHPEARLSVLTTRRGAAALADDGWGDVAELVALPADEGERVRRLAAELYWIPQWCRRHRPTLIHSLASLGPIGGCRVPQVITLHDLTMIRIATFSRSTTLAMGQIALRSARASSRIITATEASKAELIQLGKLDAESIDVIPHGRRPIIPAPQETIDDIRMRLDLAGRRVVVCVAAKRPHKNQELLIRALPHLPADVLLVLAGHGDPYVDTLRALAAELGVSERVRIPDYLSNEELEALWTLADAAAFPTRGEGFGLPVIEAFDRGVAVACSDIPVLLEVGGGLAHHFDPDQPEQAAQAIVAALTEPEGLRAQRTGHAAQFSWERAAAATWASYERALATATGR